MDTNTSTLDESLIPLTPQREAEVMRRINSIRAMRELEMHVVRLAEGYCELRMAHQKKYDGIFGSFHGGLMMAAADTAACWAVLTRVADIDVPMATTDMNIRFLAPCRSDLTARARVIKQGRTMCPVTVDLFDADEKHVAVAQVNYMLLPAARNT